MPPIINFIVIIIFIYFLFKYGNIKNATNIEKAFIVLIITLMLPGNFDIYSIPYSILMVLMLLYVLYRRFRNIYYTIDAYDDINYLNREIDTRHNPSIIGYLVNMKLNLCDFTADIMNLYAKKVIDLEKISSSDIKYKLKIGKNFNRDELCESDKYIIDNLIINKERLFYKFNFQEWEKLVVNEYRKTGLIKENITAYLFIATIVILSALIIGLIILAFKLEMIVIGFVFSGLIICLYKALHPILIAFFITVNDVCLSKYGKEEFKKWVKFKKFMQEYTFIKDKKIEDIIIYEKYIPYSTALGIVKDYEDTMFKIFTDFEIERIKKDVVE